MAKTHGLSTDGKNNKTKLYKCWLDMKARCTNKKNKEYANYGGRNIAVCKSWLNSYEKFHNWAKDSGYADGLTIDRINCNGNYTPRNCRFVSVKENCRNKRNNVMLTHNGITKHITDWSRELGGGKALVTKRLSRGWPIDKALSLRSGEKI